MNQPAHLTAARGLTLRPRTLDREARTVEAVASAGGAVQRRDQRGPFVELLSLDPAHVDLSRLIGGPVLDAHRQTSRRDVLGVVETARIEGGELIVSLRFSARADVADVLDDIEAGVLRGVSLGYQVAAWREETAQGVRRKVAVAWTPLELSLVPVPADPSAIIRGVTMPDPVTTETRVETGRAETNREIRAIAATAGLTREWADAQIDAEATADQARAAAFDAMRTRTAAPLRTQTVTIGADHEAPQVRAERIGEALYARHNPAHNLSEPARQFAGLTFPEIARDILKRAGVSTTGLSGAEVVTRALHTTSDFSLILGDTVGRTLRDAYRATPSGIRQVARMTTANDFRLKRRLQLSEAELPEKVNEAGEFKSSTLTEAAESYKLETYGRTIGITRQALINDDIGAFVDLSRRLGQGAAEKESQILADVLAGAAGVGPTMNDGEPLFHSSHGNVASSGAGISVTTLDAARRSMRLQTGLGGRPISVTPRYLLVSPTRETEAEGVLATIAPATVADVNVFSGRLTLIVDPRIAPSRWYVVADPAEVDGLEYAYLAGAPGPQTESRNGFEVDGVEIKVRMDFGAGFVDWRGWYSNAGA
jgi:hypothetical protein